ncbi:MAG: hypothetical protein KGH94_04370 [Candidatus Micrarchaeota archaeon]|nr:hypothetical protein [Candidatus Micrarchaeota archaeon]
MGMPKKLDARRKENRLVISTERDPSGWWQAKAAGHSSYASTKKASVRMIRDYFGGFRKDGIGPQTLGILVRAYALMRGQKVDGTDRVSLEEAFGQIGGSEIRRALRRDFSKRLANAADRRQGLRK